MLGNWFDVNDPKDKLVFFSQDRYIEIHEDKDLERYNYKISVELTVTYNDPDFPNETITKIGEDEITVSGGKDDGTYKRDPNPPMGFSFSPKDIWLRDPAKDTPIMGAWVHETDNSKKRFYNQTTMTTFVIPFEGMSPMPKTVSYTNSLSKQSVAYRDGNNDDLTLVVEDFDGNSLKFFLPNEPENPLHEIKRQPIKLNGSNDSESTISSETPDSQILYGWQQYISGKLTDNRIIYLPITDLPPEDIILTSIKSSSNAPTPTPLPLITSLEQVDPIAVSMIVIPIDDFDNPRKICVIEISNDNQSVLYTVEAGTTTDQPSINVIDRMNLNNGQTFFNQEFPYGAATTHLSGDVAKNNDPNCLVPTYTVTLSLAL